MHKRLFVLAALLIFSFPVKHVSAAPSKNCTVWAVNSGSDCDKITKHTPQYREERCNRCELCTWVAKVNACLGIVQPNVSGNGAKNTGNTITNYNTTYNITNYNNEKKPSEEKKNVTNPNVDVTKNTNPNWSPLQNASPPTDNTSQSIWTNPYKVSDGKENKGNKEKEKVGSIPEISKYFRYTDGIERCSQITKVAGYKASDCTSAVFHQPNVNCGQSTICKYYEGLGEDNTPACQLVVKPNVKPEDCAADSNCKPENWDWECKSIHPLAVAVNGNKDGVKELEGRFITLAQQGKDKWLEGWTPKEVVPVPCENFKNNDLVITAYENSLKDKSCSIRIIRATKVTGQTTEQGFFLYSDHDLAFFKLQGQGTSDAPYTVESRITEKQERYKTFCDDVTKVFKFYVDAKTVVAWAALRDPDYFLVGKDDKDLLFDRGNGLRFPSDIRQYATIKKCFPDIRYSESSTNEITLEIETVDKWLRKPDAIIAPLNYNGVTDIKLAKSILTGTILYQLAENPSWIRVPAYRNAFYNVKYIHSKKEPVPPVEDPNNKTSGMLDELLLGSLYADGETYDKNSYKIKLGFGKNEEDFGGAENAGYKLYKERLTNVSSKIQGPFVSTSGVNNNDGKLNCKTSDKLTAWQKFKCSITGDALVGGLQVGLMGLEVYLKYYEWNEDLKLAKQRYQEGVCYPYKASAGQDGTFTVYIGGQAQQYNLYQFCKLSASGLLSYLNSNPCLALSQNPSVPRAAVMRCYNIQGTGFNGTYGSSSTPPVTSAAGNNNNDDKKEKEKEKKKDDAATTPAAAPGSTPTTSGTNNPDDKKKQKYEVQPYTSSNPSLRGFKDPYYYGGSPTDPNATTAAQHPTTSTKPSMQPNGANQMSLEQQIKWHTNIIQDNILKK